MKKIKYLAVTLILMLISNLRAETVQNEIVLASSREAMLDAVVQEVGTIAFGKHNLKFTIKEFPKEKALSIANSGKVDGDAYRVFDLHQRTKGEYPNLIRVDEPYISIYYTAFVTDKHKHIEVFGWKNLSNYRVAGIKGNKTMEVRLKKFVPKNNRFLIETYAESFKMLLSDKIDVIVAKPSVGVNFLKKHNNLHMIGKFESTDIYIYLHEKHEGLVSKIESEIRKMKNDGTLQKIEERVLKNLIK